MQIIVRRWSKSRRSTLLRVRQFGSYFFVVCLAFASCLRLPCDDEPRIVITEASDGNNCYRNSLSARKMDEEVLKNDKRTREQIEYAKDLIAEFSRSRLLDKDRGWAEAWFGFSLRWSDKLPAADQNGNSPAYVAIPNVFVPQFVESARSSESVLDLLMFVFGTRLRANASIPPAVVDLAGEHLVDGIHFPPTHKRSALWTRDYVVFHVMKELCFHYGIRPTKGRDHRGQRRTDNSASQIIAAASKDADCGLTKLSVDAAQKIWSTEQSRSNADEPSVYAMPIHLNDEFDDPEGWVWV